MKTRLKILLGFLSLALLENIGFPIAANHGRFDPANVSMQPYLVLTIVILAGLIYTIALLYKRPLPGNSTYTLGKLVLPITFIALIVSVTGLIPMYWTLISTLIFALHILGILLSLLICISFFQNKAIES